LNLFDTTGIEAQPLAQLVWDKTVCVQPLHL